jgi:hypothetical protein
MAGLYLQLSDANPGFNDRTVLADELSLAADVRRKGSCFQQVGVFAPKPRPSTHLPLVSMRVVHPVVQFGQPRSH